MKGILILSNKWDTRFLRLAAQVGEWSKDPSTCVGAIAVNDRNVVAQGYNGFPRNIHDDDERYKNREDKYKYIVHAEMNVIYNATYNGVSLHNTTLYVHGLPVCNECAKGVIQVGIKRVVMSKTKLPDKWKESWQITQNLFKEANVKWEFIDVSDTRMD
tara:strand:- start:577 stop:1053 length:477 start_codon:yes stop_codon:yes gene_type:complete